MNDSSEQKWSEVILEALTDIDDTTERKFRNWFITINNYTAEEVEKLIGDDYQYMVFQYEKGDECGTPHLHAFIYYKNPRVWPKKKFPRADIRIPRNVANVIRYCTKSETRVEGPYEYGTKPSQGFRSDLEDLHENIKSGAMTVRDILLTQPMKYHQYGRTLMALEDAYNEEKFRTYETATVGIWLYGFTAAYKSRSAFQNYSPNTHYNKNLSRKGIEWWDKYRGQEIVILDDYRGQFEFSELLTLLDWTPKDVERRGREPVPFRARIVVITSCKHPESIYKHSLSEEEKMDQLYRRCLVHEMKGKEICDLKKITDNFRNIETNLAPDGAGGVRVAALPPPTPRNVDDSVECTPAIYSRISEMYPTQ